MRLSMPIRETMHSAPYRLDELPVEILRHIASLGNCETVLALSEVNNTLRAACNDCWVYKALIDNRNGYGTPKWPHHLPLTMQSPVSSWARYALADSKAIHDNASNPKLTSIASWAPQLFAHHREFFLRQKPALLSVNSRFFRSIAQSLRCDRADPHSRPYSNKCCRFHACVSFLSRVGVNVQTNRQRYELADAKRVEAIDTGVDQSVGLLVGAPSIAFRSPQHIYDL